MSACVVLVFRLLWATVAIFVESSNNARSGQEGRTQIVQGPLQALLSLSLSLSPPSYSKANLGITHTESLFCRLPFPLCVTDPLSHCSMDPIFHRSTVALFGLVDRTVEGTVYFCSHVSFIAHTTEPLFVVSTL